MWSSNLFSVVPDESFMKSDDEAGMLSSDNCEDLAKVATRNTKRDIVRSLRLGNDYTELPSSADDDVVILNDKDGSDWIENGKVNVLTSALQNEDHKYFTSVTPDSNPDVPVDMPENYIDGTGHENADPIQSLLPLPQLEDSPNSLRLSTKMPDVQKNNCVEMLENIDGGGTDRETAVAIQSLLPFPQLEDSPNYLMEMHGAAAGHQTDHNLLPISQLEESPQLLGSHTDKLAMTTENSSEIMCDNGSDWANVEINSCPQNFAFGPKRQDSPYPSNGTSGQTDDSDDEVQILYVKNSTSILINNNETLLKRQSNKNIDFNRNLETCSDKRENTLHIDVWNENVWSDLKQNEIVSDLKNNAVKIPPKQKVYKKIEDYFPKMPKSNSQFPKLEKSYFNIKQEATEVLPKATENIILETDMKKEFTKYPYSQFPSLVKSYIDRKQETAEVLPKATEKIILKTDTKKELSKYPYDISSEISGDNYSQKQDLLFRDMMRINISQTIESIANTPYSSSNSKIGIKHTDPTQYINALLDAQKDNSKNSQKSSKKKIPLNDDAKVIRHMIKNQDDHQKKENDEADEDEEELGHAETYADYMPSKLKIGIKHPDAVVETSSLSSVQPPDTYYNLSIPEDVIDSGLLSALQLEAITYACQKHEHILPDGNRAGFLIGDGAGVGKGRTLAGIIYENYLLGRKRAIWLSVSNDLKYDAERDLRDIGATRIEVCSLSKLKYAKISSKTNGSFKKGCVFATYSSLVGKSHSGGVVRTRLNQLVEWCGSDFEGCIVFDECHKAKNICPVGNGKPSRTGLTVLQLQNMLPKARIVYASATGACEPRHMAYMTRLGLWGESTPFREFMTFSHAVDKRGVGAMEMVSMDMKLRGLYIARQLSFAGVTFTIEEIALSQELINMYDQAVALWVEAHIKFQEAADLLKGDYTDKRTMLAQFWAAHQRFFKYLCIASKVKHVVQLTKEALKNGNCVVIGLQSTGEARTLDQLEEFGGELCDFVSSAKGVFQSLVEKHFPAVDKTKTAKLLGLDFADDQNSMSSPKPSSVGYSLRKASRTAVKRYKEDPENSCRKQSDDSDFQASGDESIENESKSSSVGLNSDTDNEHLFMGSNYKRENDYNPFNAGSDSDDPWISRQNESKRGRGKKRKIKRDSEAEQLTSSRDVIEKTLAMKVELIQKIEELGTILPPNTLDQLIDELGGPENVAEMTGRKGRIVRDDDGTKRYESRSVQLDVSLDKLNMIEKEKFMSGEKLIAIISEAASSGISLQSDRRVKNQARRVHVTLELPWSADRAIQQFGRTHRSNQVNAPEYLFLISDLAGERRFASIVAKRLESLGALTQGDRRATESKDLSQFNIDNKYGRIALETTLSTIMGLDVPLVPPPSDYLGDFFYDIRQALIGVAMVVPDKLSGFLVLNKDSGNMSKFLNRILGLPVALQNRLFQYFSDTLDDIVAQAIKAGRYDRGILDLGATGDSVKKVQSEEFIQKYTIDRNKTELHTVLIERGMSWEAALQKLKQCYDPDEGFYLARQTRNYKRTTVLAVRDSTQRSGGKIKEKLLRIYRPNTGLNPKPETVQRLNVLYCKVTEKEVERHWKQNYEASLTECSHWYWYGQCRRRTLGFMCEVGLRLRQYHVLSGSVLAVWAEIETVLYEASSSSAKLQIVRLRMEDGSRIVGCLIPNNSVERLRKVLKGEESVSFLAEEL